LKADSVPDLGYANYKRLGLFIVRRLVPGSYAAVQIRKALTTDTGVLISLMEEFYAESNYSFDRQHVISAFNQLLADSGLGQVWIAEENDTALGYIVLTVGFSMEYGGYDAFVEDLYIRPAYRQSGLGTGLMEVLVAECRRRYVRAIHLEVDRDNIAAKRLYKRFGFIDNERQLLTRRLEKAVHEI